ncbi:MAG: hypothetical protein ABWU84_04400 [Pyrobaculum sp.]|uniref:hypothetical protein n=1 Tax=Pyrobaculum sp. TaxID=2004705 RepID=UPI003EED8D3A
MPTDSSRRKKRRRIFFIALAALIFAETGYILGTTGLIYPLLAALGWGRTASAAFSDVLAVSQSYVFYNGTIKGPLSPDKYNDAYVYVISYAPGVVLPQNLATLIALDAAEKPVYVLPVSQYRTPINPEDFVDVLPDNAKYPVILLVYPPDKATAVSAWVSEVAGQVNVRLELRGDVVKSTRQI